MIPGRGEESSIKASKFSEAHIAFVLKQAEGRCGGCRGMPQGRDQPGDVFQLEEEVCGPDALGDEAAAPARRGKCQAEADRRRPVPGQGDALGCALKKALRPGRKRELVDKVRHDWKVSVRRACSTLRIDRALYVYKSERGDQAVLKGRIKEICETRVRYGPRRVHVLLQRDGWTVNVKRVYRLYRELGLQLRNKTPRRRVKAKLRDDRTEARQINETWAMDFVHDRLATGRKIPRSECSPLWTSSVGSRQPARRRSG